MTLRPGTTIRPEKLEASKVGGVQDVPADILDERGPPRTTVKGAPPDLEEQGRTEIQRLRTRLLKQKAALNNAFQVLH